MKALLDIEGKKIQVDFSKGKDISIPLFFNGEQPNTYGVDKATAKPYQDGQFIGDTRKGGPCNFETYSFTPHCNGTHTECIGHITDERIDILSSLNEEMIPATLISITPKSTNEIKKCTYLRVCICFSGSCFSNSIMSTQKDVVSDVSAESALE